MPRAETPAFSVIPAEWPRDEAAIAELRRRVFIEEQAVPESMEWEDQDADCDWFLARTGEGAPLGIVRLTPDGHLGRMAVLAEWRRQGVGSVLLAAALEGARRKGWRQVRLHAQTHALGFYGRFGFQALGAEFMEAGIPHYEMVLELTEQ